MIKIQKMEHLVSYYFRSFLDMRGINEMGETPIIVNVQTPLKFRFYYRLIYILNFVGYNVFIYLPSPRSFYNFARMGGGLDLLPPVKLITRIPRWFPSAVYCSDRQDQLWNRNWRRKIYLELDPGKPSSEVINPIFIPFSVHDYIHRCFWKDRQALLANQKNIRMLFSGDYRGYQDQSISKVLGKMERQEIVDIYRNHPNTITISTQEQLDEISRQPPSKKFYFVDGNQFRIAGPKWLEVLSRVDVFLSPPGVVNPMCYNANEAMAMGAIPLINYPEWFHPHLTDHKNSFVFSTREQLVAYLDQIAAYSAQELAALSSNVLNYFDQFQSDEYLLKKMQEYGDRQVVSFIMNVEQENLQSLQPGSIAITSE